jgi:hypothetical protein
MLASAALLTLLLSLLQIIVHIRAFGGATVRGNRENYPEASGLAARVQRPRMLGWWARSDSTTQGKPLKRLRYREFEPRCCP